MGTWQHPCLVMQKSESQMTAIAWKSVLNSNLALGTEWYCFTPKPNNVSVSFYCQTTERALCQSLLGDCLKTEAPEIIIKWSAKVNVPISLKFSIRT